MRDFRTLGVIGAGAWGTALAQVGARAGLRVRLWAHEAEVAEAMAAARENAAYLPGVRLEDAVAPTRAPADLADADLILAACPAQHMRATLAAFAPHLAPSAPVVLCAKGVEQGSLRLMSEVAAEVLPANPIAVLSGPSFAAEVARDLPCAVTLACADIELGEAIARAIALPSFRPYVADDLVGAEAGGAVKNVLAIACGVVEGRGLGRSAHAGLITRGFAEMTRLGVALGRASGDPGRPLRVGRSGADLLQPPIAQHESWRGARPWRDVGGGAGRQALHRRRSWPRPRQYWRWRGGSAWRSPSARRSPRWWGAGSVWRRLSTGCCHDR